MAKIGDQHRVSRTAPALLFHRVGTGSPGATPVNLAQHQGRPSCDGIVTPTPAQPSALDRSHSAGQCDRPPPALGPPAHHPGSPHPHHWLSRRVTLIVIASHCHRDRRIGTSSSAHHTSSSSSSSSRLETDTTTSPPSSSRHRLAALLSSLACLSCPPAHRPSSPPAIVVARPSHQQSSPGLATI